MHGSSYKANLFVRLLRDKVDRGEEVRHLITIGYVLGDVKLQSKLDVEFAIVQDNTPFDQRLLEELALIATKEEFAEIFWSPLGVKLPSATFSRILEDSFVKVPSGDIVRKLVGAAVDHLRGCPNAFVIPSNAIAMLLQSEDTDDRVIGWKAAVYSDFDIRILLSSLLKGLQNQHAWPERAGSLFALRELLNKKSGMLAASDNAPYLTAIVTYLEEMQLIESDPDLRASVLMCLSQMQALMEGK